MNKRLIVGEYQSPAMTKWINNLREVAKKLVSIPEFQELSRKYKSGEIPLEEFLRGRTAIIKSHGIFPIMHS